MNFKCIFLIHSISILTFSIFIIINFGSCQKSSNSHWFTELTGSFRNETIANILESSSSKEMIQSIYMKKKPSIINLSNNKVIILNRAIAKVKALFQEAENIVEVLTAESEKLNAKSRKRETNLTKNKVKFYDKNENQTSASGVEIYTDEDAVLYYYNAKCVCGHQLEEEKNTSYCYSPANGFSPNNEFDGNEISLSSSAVHIPVDVYNEGPDVLRDIAWSQDMDPFLISQSCNMSNGNIKWLYVATLSGVMRYFPAQQWNLECGEDSIDLYDTRTTPWFVQSMSSPKDVLVMIDTSGSITGLTLNLVLLSVRHIMSSLSHNDFFNVFLFNETADFLSKNCPGLMQAVPKNKQMIIKLLDGIKVGKPSNFTEGFDFAFNVLSNNNSAKSMRASCNPLILLLSDGGAEYPNEIFEQWNLDKKTRIFTYSVGKHFSSTTSLKDMACNNRGQFSTIPSDSATHFQTMEYLIKLSKPMPHHKMLQENSNGRLIKWTLPYEDRLGLGTVMSVSKPFNKVVPEDHQHDNRVDGVVGADILYRDIKNSMDTSEWGVNSYSFGTENNGYLFYHPLLRQGRLNSPVIVDVEELEHMNVNEMRKRMIDRESGDNMALERLILSQDGKHVTKLQYSYSFKPVPESEFSVAFGYPVNSMYRLKPTQSITDKSDLNSILLSQDGVFSFAYGLDCGIRPANRTCQINQSPAATPQAGEELADANLLENVVKKAATCIDNNEGTQQVDELFLHGQATYELARSWSNSTSSNMVQAVFVATDSKPSVLRIKHYEEESYRKEIESYLMEPAKKDYFLRPLLSPDLVVFSLMRFAPAEASFSTTARTSPSTSAEVQYSYATTASWSQTTVSSEVMLKSYFVVSEAIRFPVTNNDEITVLPAVTGSVVSYEELKGTLFNMSAPQCSGSSDCPQAYNCWNQTRMCVILDDGGLLLLSNQESHQKKIGDFFGYVDGELMRNLVNRDFLFQTSYVFDHQAVCPKPEDDINAACRKFLLPSVDAVLSTGWWLSSTFWLMIQNFLYFVIGFVASVLSDVTTISFEEAEYRSPNSNVMKEHCVIRTLVHSFGNHVGIVEGEAECKRSYTANRIPDTNLVFLIADLDDEDDPCSKPYSSSDMQTDVTDEFACPSERYRKPPDNGQCYDVRHLAEELDKDCGAVQLFSPTTLIIINTFIIYVMRLLYE